MKTVMKSRKTSSSRKYYKIDTGTNKSPQRQLETDTTESESSMLIGENSRDDRFEIGEVGSESTCPGSPGSDEMNLSSDNVQGSFRIEECIILLTKKMIILQLQRRCRKIFMMWYSYD
eukprot:296475_1